MNPSSGERSDSAAAAVSGARTCLWLHRPWGPWAEGAAPTAPEASHQWPVSRSRSNFSPETDTLFRYLSLTALAICLISQR